MIRYEQESILSKYCILEVKSLLITERVLLAIIIKILLIHMVHCTYTIPLFAIEQFLKFSAGKL